MPIAYGAPTQAVKADPQVNGVRYYEGAYFLIVYTDGKGGLKSEVKFLPDLTRKRAIDPYAYLAKNDTTLTFENGMLTSAKSVIDEAAIPKAAIAALEKVVVAGLKAANRVDGTDKVYLPNPVIYKIGIQPSGKLELLRGETLPADSKGIQVTLQEPEK